MSYRFALAAVLFAVSAGGFVSTCSAASLGDVEHIIVIYLENHSFDNLFGFFPNADGIAAAGATKRQVDENGRPYDVLPRAMEKVNDQLREDLRFPDNLSNQPFSIEAYVPIRDKTGDPIHRFSHGLGIREAGTTLSPATLQRIFNTTISPSPISATTKSCYAITI